jgi:hypothetical protein
MLGGVFSMFLGLSAAAQDGHYGVDHDKWHHEFYATLERKDGSRMPCCSQNDCRPTQSRMVGNQYEVKVDGRWLSVPENTIIDVVAPDGGAHVCAPKQDDYTRRAVLRDPPTGQLRFDVRCRLSSKSFSIASTRSELR